MNNNFPKLNSANFTITDDFVKDLARPDYRIILFKVYAESQSNGSHEDVFAYCDYIDEDVIVADLPMRVIGNIQAEWLTFKYLAIENNNYNAFIKNHQTINSIMSDTSLEWKNAFDRVNIEEGDNNLKVEATGSNYIFFDFSDYNLNCSIQLLNTFDKGDREFIHSHYHSKNTTQSAILATDDYLGYYDDVEYSKLDSDESSGNLRSAIEIENDEFNGSKPSELNLKHKSNFVRMFRPEEYYHMGDFTIKLLGKPLQPSKFKYAPDEADGDTKGSRENLNVLGVTNPADPITGNRDLQYVDMYDYNKYLQPIFRNWDKNSNTNPHVITKENPYLFTIKKINTPIDNFSVKSFTSFFRILTSDELLEVTISCSIGMTGQPLSSKLSAIVKVTSGHSNSDSFFEIYKDKYSLYYKEVGTSLQIYFDVCEAPAKSVLLLEAGVQSYNGTKDETTLIYEEGITGNSGSTKLTQINFIANTDAESAIAGYTTQPGGSTNPTNLWSGEIISDNPVSPKLDFISLGNSLYDNQYAKFVFSDWNTYCNKDNPWGDSDEGVNRIETSVSLIGGLHSQNQERVAFGTPYLCVTKGMKVCGTSYFSGKAQFDSNTLFKSDLTHKGNNSERAFITFKDGNSNGDALLIKGLHGTTFLGSGETMSAGDGCDTPWDKLTKIYNMSDNHPDITSHELSATDEQLVLLADKNMLFFTNCNNGNGKNYIFEFTDGGNFKIHRGNIEVNNMDNSSVDVSVKVKNKNGIVSLHSSTNRGVFDNTKGEWLIASVSNFKGQDNNLQSMTGVYIGAKSDNTYIHKHLTTLGNLTVKGTSTLTGNASLKGTLTVDGNTTLKGTTTCNDNVTLSKSGNVQAQYLAKNGNANSQVSLHTHSNKGVYDNDASKWIIAKENSKEQIFTGFNFVPNSGSNLNLGASDRYWNHLYVKNIHANNIEGAVLEWGKSVYAINLTSTTSGWYKESSSLYTIKVTDLIKGDLKSNLRDGALIIIFYFFSNGVDRWFYNGAKTESTRIKLKYNGAGFREYGYYNGIIMGTFVKSTGYLSNVVAN